MNSVVGYWNKNGRFDIQLHRGWFDIYPVNKVKKYHIIVLKYLSYFILFYSLFIARDVPSRLGPIEVHGHTV